MNGHLAYAQILSGANLVKTYGSSYALAGSGCRYRGGRIRGDHGSFRFGKDDPAPLSCGIIVPDAGVVETRA
ncbi:hypothetical protein GCM10023063_48780 [Arthrobacter methylotrophus]